MIHKCSECKYFEKNSVYINVDDYGYCKYYHFKCPTNKDICDNMKNLTTTKEYYEKQIGQKKNLLDCTLQEISKFCHQFDNQCRRKDNDKVYCPLLQHNDPFNECILTEKYGSPDKWENYKDIEIIL